MRIGVIGTGRIGSTHARTLAVMSDVSEVVLYDADPRRAKHVADEVRGRCVDSVDALLSQEPDGVVIASASDTHAQLVVSLARRRLPVFCEKPVAPDLARTLDVVHAVHESGARVQVGFQRRFDAGYAAARLAVAGGQLGQLRRVHTVTADPAPPPADYVPVSGGIYRDCLIHDWDILRYVTGREVVEVHALGANRGADVFRDCDDVDETVVLLSLDDGTLVTSHGSRYNGAGYDVRMELAGTGSTLAVGLDARTAVTSPERRTTFPEGPPHEGFQSRFAAAYEAEMAAFLDVVRGAESPCTVNDALEALYVAEAATLSRTAGRAVTLTEVRS